MHLSVMPLALFATGVACYVSKQEWKPAPNHSNHSSERIFLLSPLKRRLFLAPMYVQGFQASVINTDLTKTMVLESSVRFNSAAFNFYQ